jgi:hypothetical protein
MFLLMAIFCLIILVLSYPTFKKYLISPHHLSGTTPIVRSSSSSGTFPQFRTTTDGPFSITFSDWPQDYAPVSLKLPPGKPRAVLLLFHGCNHAGVDFFRLLEERAIVASLIDRGFAAVAFTSSDRLSGCWSDIDLASVKRSFTRLGFESSLPTFAFGASSGGSFVTILPRSVPVDGVIVEISPGDPSATDLSVPTAFIYMERDVSWASKTAVEDVRKRLAGKGVPSEAFEVRPFKLGRQTFSEKLSEFFDNETSRWLFDTLVKRKFIGVDGALEEDPRRSEIVSATIDLLKEKSMVETNVLGLLKENIVELFNAAWGYHEMTREYVMDAIDFLLKHTKKSLA